MAKYCSECGEPSHYSVCSECQPLIGLDTLGCTTFYENGEPFDHDQQFTAGQYFMLNQ